MVLMHGDIVSIHSFEPFDGLAVRKYVREQLLFYINATLSIF